MPESDVIVVGAGPAGAASSYYLARKGYRVTMIDRRRFPRDKSCGDAVTRPAIRLLAEIGVLDELTQTRRVSGVRIFMRSSEREFRPAPGRERQDHAYGLVVPRFELDDAIVRAARGAGAELVEGTVNRILEERGVTTGVEVTRDGNRRQHRAQVVVAADGAASRIARQASLIATPRGGLGFAIRCYLEGIKDLDDLLEFYMPLSSANEKYLLPSYGWVFPIAETAANVGVGIFAREGRENVRDLFARFLEALRERDPRFATARGAGEWKGAPLRFDFAPERCWAPGLLLVGDAAGMVSPFTGEGISYALESAKLAARAIDGRLSSSELGTLDWSAYADELRQRFSGYFETGRHSSQRYQLLWKVIDDTFDSEKPLFTLARRAALLPEGIGGLYGADVLEDISPLLGETAELRGYLAAVGQVLGNTVRGEWPFLARLYAASADNTAVNLRPAVLVHLASSLGNPRDASLITLGVTLELGAIAALAQLSVDPHKPKDLRHETPDWGSKFAILVNNFLLSKSLAMSVEEDPALTAKLTEALTRMCGGRMRELRTPISTSKAIEDRLSLVAETRAALFPVSCGLAAQASDLPRSHLEALVRWGREVGIAYQLTEETRRFRGLSDQVGRDARVELEEWPPSFPLLLLLWRSDKSADRARVLLQDGTGASAAEELRLLAQESGVVEQTEAIAAKRVAAAHATLEMLPDAPAVTALGRIATYVLTRETHTGTGTET